MKHISTFLSFLIISVFAFAQNNTQNIRGYVFDKQSQSVIVGAIISIVDSMVTFQATSDGKGNYVLENIYFCINTKN